MPTLSAFATEAMNPSLTTYASALPGAKFAWSSPPATMPANMDA